MMMESKELAQKKLEWNLEDKNLENGFGMKNVKKEWQGVTTSRNHYSLQS